MGKGVTRGYLDLGFGHARGAFKGADIEFYAATEKPLLSYSGSGGLG